MGEIGWVSVLPPLIAILLAIFSRQVFISLGVGIWIGWTILSGWNPLIGVAATLDSFVNVFKDADNTRIILFSAMVGSLIALTQRSGGVNGFVQYLFQKNLIKSRKGAQILAWTLGIVIFIESSIKILIVGTICRLLFDKLKISREKLSFFADSTSAPVCMLIPLNAWGAFVIGLLAAQGVSEPTKVLIQSLPLNFYSIFAVITVLVVALTGWNFGPMKKAEHRVFVEGKLLRDGAVPLVDESITEMKPIEGKPHRARNLIVPILVMSFSMPAMLVITGHGNLTHGSGSTAVFWSVVIAIGVAAVMYRLQGLMKTQEIMDMVLKGAGGMISLALLMLLAFSLGNTCKSLGTGLYMANLTSSFLSPHLVPAIVFFVSALVAFATGTSFGTFSLMIPLAIPLVNSLGINLPLTVAAVLSGGVFGDHCSPISDTTLVASMSAACDHIDHVNTQLPYAVLNASLAFIVYIVLGFIV
ncbi:MAG: sodium:solute symporter [Candidatus Marinimicrobia bacterium CG08_land_8_20_14_0_20_45_22]|nr:MAG: sodium:solute symporter [Candidatus Marinimicrobia bacterium CG08_land_8_20_14_0_20_45_22]